MRDEEDVSESEPIMDRRLQPDRRSGEDRREVEPEAAGDERRTGDDRRKVERRKTKRSINQYDMDADVLEFVNAVNRFREGTGNRFPAAKDILQILRDLGYEKRT